MLTDAATVTATGVRLVQVDDQDMEWVLHNFPVMKNVNLPHQLDLRYVLNRTRVQGMCNCGWGGRAYKPNDEATMNLVRGEYQVHLRA